MVLPFDHTRKESRSAIVGRQQMSSEREEREMEAVREERRGRQMMMMI